MKVSNIFKVLTIALLVIAFTVSVISCKEVVVEEQQQEEEKPVVEVSNETKEEIKEETTPVVEEETPEEIEWEGMIITPIEGLRFDKGTFYAKAGNSYGLEEGEKAGVFVKDAVEINEVMESSIGLRPEVIEVLQKEIMGEEKRFVYPFPIDLEKAKADLGQDKMIKIREVASESLDEWAKKENTFWDNNFKMEISNVPLGTIIYSPVSTSPDGYLFFGNNDRRNDYYHLNFLTNSSLEGKLFRGNERIDRVAVGIDAIGIKLLPEGIEEKMVYEDEAPFPTYRSDVKMGTPVAEIISKEYLNDKYWDEKESPIDPSSEPSISMSYGLSQLKDPDKYLETGLENLLTLDKEKIPVFISPAYE